MRQTSVASYSSYDSRLLVTQFAMSLLLMIGFGLSLSLQAADVAQPKVQIPGLSFQLLTQEPNIVTPVGCAIDAQGNLLAIESNTHFRPDGYPGPQKDRLLRFVIRDRDQRSLAPETTLLDSPTWAMNVVQGPDGWIYLASRSEVIRLRAEDPKSKAVVMRLETAGNYPHNGLCGLAYGPDGKLYIGMGENFGEPFAMVNERGEGIHGGGEGGNVFRCDPDGSYAERIATGFWNPFGLCFDDAGRLWVVDNDPDASPPCRLIHVAPGADYGFQFRFGRAGVHPLQAWNGQLPGTTGYAAGTGEAPCAVVFHRGYLWVSSWGDNRIERYTIEPRGSSFTAKMDVAIQGDTNFRPVGLATGPDGSIYVTDWVDRSYTLHNKGRIWRIDFDGSDPKANTIASIPRSELDIRNASLSANDALWSTLIPDGVVSSSVPTVDSLLKAFDNPDPFVKASALWGLIRTKQWEQIPWNALTTEQRVGLLMVYRWNDLDPTHATAPVRRQRLLRAGLSDPASAVQIAALRWIAEAKEADLARDVDALLNSKELTPSVCRVALGTLEWLEKPKVEGNVVGGHRTALKLIQDGSRSALTRTIALQVMNPNDPALTIEMLVDLAKQGGGLGREAVRVLALKTDGNAVPVLANIARGQGEEGMRADATMGLARDTVANSELLKALASDSSEAVRSEAARVLEHAEKKNYEAGRPEDTNLEAWSQRLATGGNADAGWRVFFRSGAGQCAACHSFQGRGATLGPDLSTLPGTQSRQRVLESIVQPSREIGPLYVPWQIQTTDGRVLSGVKLHAPGVGEKARYLASNGETFDLALSEIEEQKMSNKSIMPSGLCNTLSDDELKDLLALLSGLGK